MVEIKEKGGVNMKEEVAEEWIHDLEDLNEEMNQTEGRATQFSYVWVKLWNSSVWLQNPMLSLTLLYSYNSKW